MKFTFNHYNINVLDLDKSLTFYKEALGLTEVRRKEAADGSFILVYLSDDSKTFFLELTWLKDRTTPYDLGDEEFHLALTAEDYDMAYELHKKMDCICYENTAMGIYFINDPDKYWIEIIPPRK